MKYAGAVLALTLGAFLPAVIAQPQPDPSARQKDDKSPAEATTSAKLSPTVSDKLNAQLPKYDPAATATEEKEKAAANAATTSSPAGTLDAPTDPEMLHLKKVTVTPRKRPRLGDDVMMTSKAYNDQLAKEKLSSLDRNVLNKFTLPSWFGGVSAAERAREERDREQRTQMANDVFGLAKVVEVTDPAQAKALRDAMNRP
ncbi:MAG: hypothetical protein ABI273_01385 [Lacunisphaera sp.]